MLPNNQSLLWQYFGLAFALSWSVWGLGAALGQARSLESFGVFLYLGTFGPMLAALWLLTRHGGKLEVLALLQRMVQVRMPWGVYLLTWWVFPLVLGLGLWILGFAFKPGATLNLLSLGVAMPINGLLTALFSPGPLGEEPGWRGYALERMHKLGDWTSSVTLGILWALWHLPIALLLPEWRELFPGQNVSLALWLVLYPPSLIALALMFLKLWKWTGQSIFICILFHGVVNTSFQILDKVNTPYSAGVSFGLLDLILWMAALVFVAMDRLIFERPKTNRSRVSKPSQS